MADDTPVVTQSTPCDDSIRKWLGVLIIVQFVALVGWVVWQSKQVDNTQLIIGAEISFVSAVINYYFGSSSGSTAKSALLEAKK